MIDIHHQIKIGAPAAQVYGALTSVDGLAQWWTKTTSGSSKAGEKLQFRFDEHLIEMRVDGLEKNKRVEWRCTKATPDWNDTRVTFELSGA